MTRKIGVATSILLMIIETFSSLFFTPFLIRSFGQAEFGVYSLSLSLATYLTLLDLGVGNALIRYITKYRVSNDQNSSRKLKGIMILFYSIISVVCFIIGVILVALFGLFFSNGLMPDEIVLGKKLLLLSIINVAITLLFSPYSKILIGYEYFALSRILDILKILIRVSISIAVLLFGGKSIEITIVALLSNLALSLLTFFICNKKIAIKPIFAINDNSFLKEIWIYVSFLFLQMVAAQINNMTDHILLGVLSASTIIAIYQVGTQINQYFLSVGSAFNGVLQPGVVKMVEKEARDIKSFQKEMVRVGRIISSVLLLIFVVFIINGQMFIKIWVGGGYEKSYIVACILMFGQVLILPQNIGTQILYSLDKHKILAVFKVLVAFLNVGLTFVLIVFFDDAVGAAIGTFIACFMGDFILLNILFSKELKISIFNYNFSIFKGTFVSAIFTLLIGYFFSFVEIGNVWVSFLLNCIIMTVSFLCFMLLFGFNIEEKNRIKKTFYKLFNQKEII